MTTHPARTEESRLSSPVKAAERGRGSEQGGSNTRFDAMPQRAASGRRASLASRGASPIGLRSSTAWPPRPAAGESRPSIDLRAALESAKALPDVPVPVPHGSGRAFKDAGVNTSDNENDCFAASSPRSVGLAAMFRDLDRLEPEDRADGFQKILGEVAKLDAHSQPRALEAAFKFIATSAAPEAESWLGKASGLAKNLPLETRAELLPAQMSALGKLPGSEDKQFALALDGVELHADLLDMAEESKGADQEKFMWGAMRALQGLASASSKHVVDLVHFNLDEFLPHVEAMPHGQQSAHLAGLANALSRMHSLDPKKGDEELHHCLQVYLKLPKGERHEDLPEAMAKMLAHGRTFGELNQLTSRY